MDKLDREDALKLKKIKKSLNYSIIDGALNSIKVGFGESFLVAFAVFLKANNIQIGLIGSLPQALGSFFQLFSNKLLRLLKSRKRLIIFNVLLEALMFIPIALTFFLNKFKPIYLVIFISLYWIFGMMIGPAWNSWMADIVHEKKRGSYFGKRNKIAGITTFIALIIAGFILQKFSNGATQYYGFLIIFAIALISRLVSLFYIARKYEPNFQVPQQHQSFIDFIKRASSHNYGLLVLYLCFMHFSIFLSAPFFVAYMLKDLNFDYMTFTILNAIAIIAKFIAMPLWGKASDRFGARKVLSLAGYLMPLMPILWLFAKSPIYIGFVQAYAGFVWAAFELAAFNFILDATKPETRPTYVAYYNVLNGAAIILGALIGGIIVRYNHIFWSKYLLVFLISGLFRYLASLIFVPKLREVREVEHISYHQLILNLIDISPTMDLVYDLIPYRIRKKIKFKKEKPI